MLGSGSERTSWYYIDGQKELKVTVGHVHRGELPPGTLKHLMRQLRVNPEKFFLLADCPWTGKEYHRHIVAVLAQALATGSRMSVRRVA